MTTRIIPKKSTVADKVPLSTDLLDGEIAINLTDAIFYAKHPDGSIVNLSGAPMVHTHEISEVNGLTTELSNSSIKSKYEANDDTNAFTNAEQTKLAGIEAGAEVNVKSDWNASTGDAEILNKPPLGTASDKDVEYFASAAQGDNADTAYGWGDHSTFGYEFASNKGVANGYASLDGNGTVPSAQLPSFVDDILEYADQASFPSTGETGKIYVALDTNKTYRWSGSSYVYITSGAVDSVNGYTGIINLVSSDIPENGNLYHTTARARNAISVSGDLSYDSGTGVVSFNETYSTPSELLTAIKTVDGAGSGLNADTLDGIQGNQYVRNDIDQTLNGRYTFNGEQTINGVPDKHALRVLKAFDSPDEPAAIMIASDTDTNTDDLAFEIRGNGTGASVDTSTTMSSPDTTFAIFSSGMTTIGYSGLGVNYTPPNNASLAVNGIIDAKTAIYIDGVAVSVDTHRHDNATTSTDGFMSSGDKTKLNNIEAGAQVNDVTTVAGRVGDVVLSTSDVSEGTNLYYTDARARASVSATGDISYDSGTGVISFNETYSTAAEVKTAYESNADTNAFTDALLSKLNGIEAGAQVNTVDSVNGYTGIVSLGKADVGLGNVRNVTGYSQTEANANFVDVSGDNMTGSLRINTSDDGVNDLQIGGSSSIIGNTGFGNVDPAEKVDVNGNARIRNENQMKFGGSGISDSKFAMQFNANTNSLDFNFIGG